MVTSKLGKATPVAGSVPNSTIDPLVIRGEYMPLKPVVWAHHHIRHHLATWSMPPTLYTTTRPCTLFNAGMRIFLLKSLGPWPLAKRSNLTNHGGVITAYHLLVTVPKTSETVVTLSIPRNLIKGISLITAQCFAY
jgi:hypothetical protein